jgi:hypothetical protein
MFSYLFSCMLETGNTYLYLIIKEKEFPWFGPFWSSISTKIFVRHPRLNASSRRPRASPTRAYDLIAPKSNLIPLIQATPPLFVDYSLGFVALRSTSVLLISICAAD